MTTQREALELARDVINAEIAAYSDDPDTQNNQLHRAIAAIDAALATPDPQPVAWMTPGGDVSLSKAWCDERCRPDGPQPIPLYAAPPAPAREISEQQLIDMFQQYLEDHRDDGRQISPRTGWAGYDECEWDAFVYGARAVLAAKVGK